MLQNYEMRVANEEIARSSSENRKVVEWTWSWLHFIPRPKSSLEDVRSC